MRIAILEALSLGGAMTATEVAATALVRLIRERQLDRCRTWQETKASYPRRWRDAADETQLVFYVTADELA